MTLYRGCVLDVPGDPFAGAALRAELDGAVVVSTTGVILARGSFAEVRPRFPDQDVVSLDGLLLPGFVDTHVHYPQLRAIGGLGMPLLQWLDRCALPEEARLADTGYAVRTARDFLAALVDAGTTSALVFGSHFAAATDSLFAEAAAVGLNVTTGLVLSDRGLRPDLLSTADRCHQQSTALIDRWHGAAEGRLRFAVTPRFALSASDAVLEVCAALLDSAADLRFTTHLNENPAEIAAVAALFPSAAHYLDTYHRHGLVGPRSVFAHNVHPADAELALMGSAGAWTAHCPTSNAALGSGLFPLARHLAHGVRVALGSDVGAGTGFWLGKEALQAYFAQQLLGPDGHRLTSVDLLYLATGAGARALGIQDRVGDLGVGKEFDALHVRPRPDSPLAVNLAAAADPADALARFFSLATPTDLAQVWSRGRPLR